MGPTVDKVTEDQAIMTEEAWFFLLVSMSQQFSSQGSGQGALGAVGEDDLLRALGC
jgi:hypothetical protein